MACILCGVASHDSFMCNAKLCFKCNQVGHQARDCQERDIVKCQACGNAGHNQLRCLKVWCRTSGQPSKQLNELPGSRFISEGDERNKRCIECDTMGHFKCRSENRSTLTKLDFSVGYDLDEFFHKRKRSDSKIALLAAANSQSDDDADSQDNKKS